jgi:hypothetical protein
LTMPCISSSGAVTSDDRRAVREHRPRHLPDFCSVLIISR